MTQSSILNTVYLVFIPPLLLMMSWELTLLAIAVIPIVAMITLLTGPAVRARHQAAAEARAELQSINYEALSQIRTLKFLGVERDIFERAEQHARIVVTTDLSARLLGLTIGTLNDLLRAVAAAVYSYVSWTLIIGGRLSLGDFIAFSAYLGYLTGPLNRMTGMIGGFQQTAVTLARAFEYLDAVPEQDPQRVYASPASSPVRLSGAVRYRGVSFDYQPGRRVLHDLSCRFERESFTCIVGSSGAGKSTVLRLLTRWAAPTAGHIELEGRELSRIPLEDVRRQVAVVWQDSSLIKGTVRDNLLIGLADVSAAEIEGRLWSPPHTRTRATVGPPHCLRSVASCPEHSETGMRMSSGPENRSHSSGEADCKHRL